VAPRRFVVTDEFVVFDTDVASLSFKQQLPPSLLARLIGTQPCITFVTLGELTKWAEMRRWGRQTRAELDRWLSLAVLLPYDRDVATVWGELQAEGAHRGRTPPQNDTWIAACCLVEDLPLATRNVKDYVGFVEHDGLALVTE
jgi:toxin FitB